MQIYRFQDILLELNWKVLCIFESEKNFVMLIKSFHQLSFLRDFMTNFLARLCCATQKYLKHKQKKNEMKWKSLIIRQKTIATVMTIVKKAGRQAHNDRPGFIATVFKIAVCCIRNEKSFSSASRCLAHIFILEEGDNAINYLFPYLSFFLSLKAKEERLIQGNASKWMAIIFSSRQKL